MAKSYYDILGVKKNSSQDEIRLAYKKAARDNHPDKYPQEKKEEATKRFHEIKEAYDTLSNPSQRSAYDSLGHDNYKKRNHEQGAGFDFSGFGFDFNDIFGSFGGGFSGFDQEKKVGEDLRYNIELTLENAFKGMKTKINIPRHTKCLACHGSGDNIKSSQKTCSGCNGRGKITVQQFIFQVEQICNQCAGKGRIYDVCLSCKGAGKLYENSSIDINIPSGVKDGMKLRIEKQGNFIKAGEAGDLYIFISIKQHKVFKVDGSNLLVTLPITIFDALLGIELKIPGIDEEFCCVQVAAGTQPNSYIILSGKGMKKFGSNNRGDLVVSFDIEIPKKLSSIEKELILKLKEEYVKNSKTKSLFEKLYSYWTS